MKRLYLIPVLFIVIVVAGLVAFRYFSPETKHLCANGVTLLALAVLSVVGVCSVFRVWEDTWECCVGIFFALVASGALYLSWPHCTLPQILSRTIEAKVVRW